MFSKIANFAARFRVPIIIFWLVLSGLLFFFAPQISRVGVIEDSQFLPKDTESSRAQALVDEKFARAEAEPAGSGLIVVYNQNGLSDQDMEQARALRDWLVSPEAPSIINGVISVFDNDALRSTLISQDQTTMLINLRFSEASASADARQAVQEIRSHIQSQSLTASYYITGSAGIAYDLLTTVQQTIDKTTLVTIILVVVLLLIIYRSPVAIFVPLITIGCAYLVARGIIGYMASWGVHISSLMDAYLVVLLFGIGTDYCLFMVSRFKEELTNSDKDFAVLESFRRIGPVILASATTVIVALLCLGISSFGMNRTSGYALAIGVGITLLAGFSLTPALISLFGKRLLWPASFQARQGESEGFWGRTGRRIVRRPALFVIPIVILMALPYLALPRIHTSVDMLGQMPETMESVRGFNILRQHFPAGELGPAYVLVEKVNGDFSSGNTAGEIKAIGDSILKVDGVARVTYFSQPVDQLRALSQQSRSTGDAVANGDLSKILFFKSLGEYLQNLAKDFPGVLQSQNFRQTVTNLTDLSSKAGQLQSGNLQNLAVILPQIKQLAYDISNRLSALADEFNLQTQSVFTAWLKSTYFSNDMAISRINVILTTDPFSSESITTIRKIRESLDSTLGTGALADMRYYVGGETATQADIMAVNDRDFFMVMGLTILGILLVTAVLLRSILAPLYMVVTVLFNFGATLGIATWLFLDLLHQGSVIYMLPIFVFVILVAVGADYNIFLVSRIREEMARGSLKESISVSVKNTGGVITACGVILAGTFATLMTAPLQMVFQIGAAIALGVIIDTFVVRAMLIPSLATLVGRWSWWPSRLFRQKNS